MSDFTNRQHRIFLKIFVPYLIFLMIPLCLGYVVYLQTLSAVKQEIKDKNLALLNQGKQLLNQRFKEIDSMAQQIAANPKIQSFQFVSDPFEVENMFKMLNVRESLNDYNLTNNFIFNYFVIFKNSGIAVNSGGTYSLPEFYQNTFHYDQLDYKQFQRLILDKNYENSVILPAMPVTVQGKRSSMVTVVKSLGLPNHSSGAILIFIDNRNIQDLLNGVNLPAGGWAYIADQKGSLLSSVANGSTVQPIELDPSDDSGMMESRPADQPMIVTYSRDREYGLTFVIAQPSSYALQKVNSIRKINETVIFASLLFGLLLAYLLAYRISKPLKKIILTVIDQLEAVPDKSGNLHRIILNGVSRLKTENERMEIEFNKQSSLLQAISMERLLKGEFKNQADLQSLLKHSAIDPEAQCFAAAIMKIDGRLRSSEEVLLHTEQLMLERVLLKETIGKLFNGLQLHDMDRDKMVLLIAFRSPLHGDSQRKIQQLLTKIESRLMNEFQFTPQFSVGGLYDRADAIARSYEEALQALQYYEGNIERRIYWYRDLPNKGMHYYFPNDLEARLINLIKAGNHEETRCLLEELFTGNFRSRKLSLGMLRLFIYDLLGSMIKLMEQANIEENEFFSSGIRTVSFDSKDGIESFYKEITDNLLFICEKQNNQKRSHNEILIGAILEFLHQSYMLPEMGLSMVGTKFQISEVYVSQFFKEQTGENFSEYLENVRMNQAKQLLRNTQLPVNRIAEEVGYLSPGSFGRAFKRIHHMSATAYRNSSTAQDTLSSAFF